jgi:DNA-binding MarR family transcriptional regulator
VPFASEPDFLVLLGLRLHGFAEADALAHRLGMAHDDVVKHLDVLERDGLVRHRPGAMGGWTLTAEGRAEGERRAAAELEASGARSVVGDAYRIFREQNPGLLRLCTDWQLRGGPDANTPNDHLDEAYDASVIARLVQTDAVVQAVCLRLAGALDRFAGYGDRLASAVAKVTAGEIEWFTKPTIDSYHTVWFELHENLLATLGIERGKETS